MIKNSIVDKSTLYFEKNFVRSIILIVMVLLIPFYRMVTYSGFVMDDAVAVQRNPLVISSRGVGEFFSRDFWGLPLFEGTWTHKSFRPITTWTYRLNFLIHGLQSSGFHIANLLLHALASVMVYCFSIRVLALNRVSSLLSMALFAVHPIHTENILYLVGRADICATIFYIAAVMEKSVWKRAILTLLAGLCKETGFTAIFLAGGIDFLKNKKITKSFIFCVAIGVTMMAWRHWYTGGTEVNMSVQDNPISYETNFFHRFLSYMYIHGKYFQLMFLPLELCYDYSLAAIPIVRSLHDVRNFLGIIAYLSLFSVANFAIKEYLNKGSSLLIICISLTIVPWLPASNILFPVGTVIGERLLYTPSLGVVCGLCGQRRKKILICGILAFFWVRSAVRVSDWASGDALFLADGHRSKSSSKTQFNLGITHMSNKEYDRAVPALIRCAAADPMSALPYWRIGQIEILKGNFKTAEAWLMEASTKFSATLMIKDEEIFHDIAVAVFQNKKIERAHFYLGLALEINANFPKGLNNFGCLLASTRPGDSVKYLKKAVELNTSSFIYLSNLIFMSRYAGQPEQAAFATTLMNTHYPNTLISQLRNDCIWEFVPAS